MEILTEDELAKLLPLSIPLDLNNEVSSPASPGEDTGAECTFCGWCENPEKCVWSVTCPHCEAPPREQCHNPSNRRLEGLHEHRWQLVKQLHGVYYVTN